MNILEDSCLCTARGDNHRPLPAQAQSPRLVSWWGCRLCPRGSCVGFEGTLEIPSLPRRICSSFCCLKPQTSRDRAETLPFLLLLQYAGSAVFPSERTQSRSAQRLLGSPPVGLLPGKVWPYWLPLGAHRSCHVSLLSSSLFPLSPNSSSYLQRAAWLLLLPFPVRRHSHLAGL